MKTSASKLGKIFWLTGGVVVALGLLSYGGYAYSGLLQANTAELKHIAALEQSNTVLKSELLKVKDENDRLAASLQVEQGKNKVFEAQIGDISATIGALKKLSATDPELLKKYSKVYFLSENYAPVQLSSMDAQYLYDKNKPQLIHSGVLPYLSGMLASALRDGIKLQVVSSYRSFYEQVAVKTSYAVTYGAGTANQFSADQGYSEHQLGTAADFTAPDIKGVFVDFEKSAGYKWLTDHGYQFGFVLSYPKNNLYYQFEPWHWRFVGIALSTQLHSQNEYFYNLSQREIDAYLISIFD